MREFVTPSTRCVPAQELGGSRTRFVSRLRCSLRGCLSILLLVSGTARVVGQETLAPFESTWRFSRGTNEASSPVTAWRNLTFNDTVLPWSSAPAPFHFGESLSIGTLLSDMRNVYTCVFLRQMFTVTNKQEVNALVLDVKYDDGFIAWINGTEVARALVTNTTYTSTASGSHEATSIVSFTNVFPSYLVNGSNILAIQAFNGTIGSSDFRIDAAVRVTRDGSRPEISSLSPQSGSSVSSLASISVVFSEAVFGVQASDLLVNDLPAATVVGTPGTNTWVFAFPHPGPGQVNVGWGESHGIIDAWGNPFDSEASTASWSYNLIDTVAPQVASVAPVAGAQVNRLTQVQVMFDEPVYGVTAADLLINLVPATNVVGTETGPYYSVFPNLRPGQSRLPGLVATAYGICRPHQMRLSAQRGAPT